MEQEQVKLRRGQKRCCNPECRAIIPSAARTCPKCAAKNVKASKRLDRMTIAELEVMIEDRRKVIKGFADAFPTVEDAIKKTVDFVELLETMGAQDILDTLNELNERRNPRRNVPSSNGKITKGPRLMSNVAV